MTNSRLLRLSVGFLLALITTRGDDVVAIGMTPYAFDLALVVPDRDFTVAWLSAQFAGFAGPQFYRHTLSRLTIATTPADAVRALPGRSPAFFSVSKNDDAWDRRSKIAQLVCLKGVALALIKDGESIKNIQVSGTGDPRQITVGKRKVHLTSFKIDNFSSSPYQLSSPKRDDGVTLFVEAQPLLSTEEALQLTAKMAQTLGTEFVQLVVRSDAYFGVQGGPPFDFFKRIVEMTEEQYYETPYVFCAPRKRDARRKSEPRWSCAMTKPKRVTPLM